MIRIKEGTCHENLVSYGIFESVYCVSQTNITLYVNLNLNKNFKKTKRIEAKEDSYKQFLFIKGIVQNRMRGKKFTSQINTGVHDH